MKKILRYMQETGGHIQRMLILGLFSLDESLFLPRRLKATDGFNLLDAVLGVRLGTCIKM